MRSDQIHHSKTQQVRVKNSSSQHSLARIREASSQHQAFLFLLRHTKLMTSLR